MSGPAKGPGKGSGFEGRLDELRREASEGGVARPGRFRVVGGPVPSGPADPGGLGGSAGSTPSTGSADGGAAPGYWGRPLLKPPVWTWEIPVYFFVGGAAGGLAILAWAARLVEPGALPLVRAALWLALAGVALSALLLVLDLGRPARFLNMLRVFKRRSPMSVGVWVLTAFGGALAAAVVGVELTRRGLQPSPAGVALLTVGLWAAAPLGALVATYTGVLIGATAVPVWNLHRGTLPLHFGVAGLGSAAALLELLGHRTPALWAVGVAAAGVETLVGLVVELSRHGASDRALREGEAAALLRGAGVLAGPAALVLRLVGLVPLAAGAFLLGALASRFGWLRAGRASARDPEAALARYGGDHALDLVDGAPEKP